MWDTSFATNGRRMKHLRFDASLSLWLGSAIDSSLGYSSLERSPVWKEGDVEVCCQGFDGGNGALEQTAAKVLVHCWLKVGDKLDPTGIEAGYGMANAGERPRLTPSNSTRIVDHSGRNQGSCIPLPSCNRHCVAARLRGDLGRRMGKWGPMNNCRSYVKKVLDDCGCSKPGRWITTMTTGSSGHVVPIRVFLPEQGYESYPIP